MSFFDDYDDRLLPTPSGSRTVALGVIAFAFLTVFCLIVRSLNA